MKHFIVAMSIAFALFSRASETMTVHFIDVGQGAATFIEFPAGCTLIDTGGESQSSEAPNGAFDSTQRLREYLEQFIGHGKRYENLTQLILTHPHKDHVRGVKYVLERLHPEYIVYNGQTLDMNNDDLESYLNAVDIVKSWYVLARKAADESKGKGTTNDIIDPFGADSDGGIDPKITALWGQVEEDKGSSGKNWSPSEFKNENNHSVVVRVDFGNASLLVTGDLEESDAASKSPELAAKPESVKKKGGIERLIGDFEHTGLLKADVFEVGHHGSHNGNSAKLSELVNPEIAVIACGPPCDAGSWSAGDYGHPREIVFDELEPFVQGTRPPAEIAVYPQYPLDKHGKTIHPPVKRTVTKAVYLTGFDGDITMTATSDGVWTVVSELGTNSRCPENN